MGLVQVEQGDRYVVSAEQGSSRDWIISVVAILRKVQLGAIRRAASGQKW